MGRKLTATIPVKRPIYAAKWVMRAGCPGVVWVTVGYTSR